MIVSALKNFFLEFVCIATTLLLYQKHRLSRALLIEFIGVKSVDCGIALYYWYRVSLFYLKLREIRRRKLTKFYPARRFLDSLDIADRSRFSDIDYYEKPVKSTSLTNLDDFSLNSSFAFDDEQDYYNRSKSLGTLPIMDSLESVGSEDERTLKILVDNSLSPAEKAMKLLDLDYEDINEVRIRLGKNILPGPSRVEKIERIITSVENIVDNETMRIDKTVETVDRRRINEEERSEVDRRLQNFKPAIGTSEKNVEENEPVSKIRCSEESPSRGFFKYSTRNPLSSCICTKAEEESQLTGIIDLHTAIKESANENFEDVNKDKKIDRVYKKIIKIEPIAIEPSRLSPRNFPYVDILKENGNFRKWSPKDDPGIFPGFRTSQTLQSFFNRDFREKGMDWLKSTLTYPGDLERTSLELFRVDDITLEKSEGSGENLENVATGQDQNVLEVETQTDFVEDFDRWRNDQASAGIDFSPEISSPSTSAQTNISDCWKNTSRKQSSKTQIHSKTLKAPIPEFSQSKLSEQEIISNKIFTRFFRKKKRKENAQEREAREMKALRIYNRYTLLEDRREMEAKKRNRLQGFVCGTDLTSTAVREIGELTNSSVNEKMDSAKIQRELDQTSKRQSRSRPQKATTKLSTLNLNLDALKTSISLSFSSENKNSLQPNKPKFAARQIPTDNQQFPRKKLSKYTKPMRFQDEKSAPSSLKTRFEELQEGRDLVRSPGFENITDRYIIPFTNVPAVNHHGVESDRTVLESVYSETILPSVGNTNIDAKDPQIDIPVGKTELQNESAISSLREAIRNIDWSFGDLNFVENNEPWSERNENIGQEHYLWDIVDDTDTITLLQSAFSSNPANTSRGFYLGPGSTELYSVSNYLDNVVEEIMKTARLTPTSDAFPTRPSNEVDYGDAYIQELEITSLPTAEDSAEETFTDSDSESEDSKRNEIFDDVITPPFTPGPIEISWNSYSREGFDVVRDRRAEDEAIEENYKNPDTEDVNLKEYRRKLLITNVDDPKNIIDIVGEEELSHLECWTRELKNLTSSYRHDDNFQFVRELRYLTNLPGFCVVKMLVDFFRDFAAVSRSTMTSRMFLTATPNSLASEEIISNQLNETSNISITHESSIRNLELPNEDVPDTSPFYFGPIKDSRPLVLEMLTFDYQGHNYESKIKTSEETIDLSKTQVERISEEIQVFPMTNISPNSNVMTSRLDLQVPPIINTPSRARIDDVPPPEDVEGTFKINSPDDSYDSLYSAPGQSNYSNNTISLAGLSSMEEFSFDPLIVANSHESSPEASSPINNSTIDNQS